MSKTAGLKFICTKCHNLIDSAKVSSGCDVCASKFFRVARDGNSPLFNNPLYDPYRERNVEDDGYEKNKVGDENGMGATGFGQRFRDDSPSGSLPVNNDYMTGTDDTGEDSVMNQDSDSYLQSPAMSAENKPSDPMNSIGPFNMHKSPNIDNARRSVFDRIRQTRKAR